MKKYLKLAFLLTLILSPRVFAASDDMFAVDLSHFYYDDGAGRIIDCNFSSGTIDANGVITIPDSAIIQRAPGEEDTTFLWEPIHGDIVNELNSGYCTMSIPQADITIPPIPNADIVIDGSRSDWDTVPIYVQDKNTRYDDISTPGSDMDYIKLAYSNDGSKLNILIKVSDAISQDVWYSMFFDNDAHDPDGFDAKPGNHQVDFAYNTGWDIVSRGWNSEDSSDWYSIDEQGEVSVSGDFIEGSVNVAALGISTDYYFVGRTVKRDASYIRYDIVEDVRIKPVGISALRANGFTNLSSPKWQTEMTFSGFQNVNREQYWYAIQVGAGHVVSPNVRITWVSGTFEGTYYENALVLDAYIGSDYIYRDPNDSDQTFLFGYDPTTAIIHSKIEVQNGTDATVSYRINNAGSWTTLWQHTIPEGQMLSFPHLSPYVRLETGYLPIPGDFDYDGKVNGGDLAVFSSAWMSRVRNNNFNMRCDTSSPRDGVIDIVDFSVFAQNWLAGTTP